MYLPGDTILITDVGDSYPLNNGANPFEPGPSLVCNTSNVNKECCRGSDHSGSGKLGDWFYPNGTVIIGNNASPVGAAVTRSSHTHQIRLNRKRTDILPPTGAYTCQVRDGVDQTLIHTATILLSKGGKGVSPPNKVASPGIILLPPLLRPQSPEN